MRTFYDVITRQWDVWWCRTFSAEAHLVIRKVSGKVLCDGTFSCGTLRDGTFVCASVLDPGPSCCPFFYSGARFNPACYDMDPGTSCCPPTYAQLQSTNQSRGHLGAGPPVALTCKVAVWSWILVWSFCTYTPVDGEHLPVNGSWTLLRSLVYGPFSNKLWSVERARLRTLMCPRTWFLNPLFTQVWSVNTCLGTDPGPSFANFAARTLNFSMAGLLPRPDQDTIELQEGRLIWNDLQDEVLLYMTKHIHIYTFNILNVYQTQRKISYSKLVKKYFFTYKRVLM